MTVRKKDYALSIALKIIPSVLLAGDGDGACDGVIDGSRCRPWSSSR